MRPLLFDLGAHPGLSARVQAVLGAERGALELRRFPDGECYLRLETSPAARAVILLCPLDGPDTRTLPVLFAAATCRELGADSVGLAAPYLAYMRQDIRFRPGEAVTSRTYAALLSDALDWLVTVDPHLHRYDSLDEIYRIPTRSLAAAPALAAWIAAEVAHPVLIGPDAESAQWVADVAKRIGAPWRVLEKSRRGDREVSVSVPDLEAHRHCTPVLLDDIVSTGATMVAALEHLRSQGAVAPVCLAVHGLFADQAEAALRQAGAARVVTCNTVVHPSNGVCVAEVLAGGIRSCLD